MSSQAYSSRNIFLLLLCIGFLCSSQSAPDRISQNLQNFTSSLKRNYFLSNEATDTRPGVLLMNSFGVGYTLANIYQKLWNVSLEGVPSSLRTLEQYVPEDYGYLLGLYKRGKMRVTSAIYSRYGNLTSHNFPSLSTLKSHLINVDYIEQPATFVDSFSSLMESGTRSHLDNELLPKGLWEKVFDNNTHGAYVNTVYYKATHPKPWKSVGEKAFGLDTLVQFLEVEGEFPVYSDANITAVIVDLQQVPPKSMIFAKPNVHIPMVQFQRELEELLLFANERFVKRKLRVQIPALNITNLSRHHEGLIHMGINQTFCNINGTNNEFAEPDFVQQPITQANHFEFASDYIELSSATGSIVSLNNGAFDVDLEEEYDADDLTSIIVNEEEPGNPLFRTTLRPETLSRRSAAAVVQLIKKLNLHPPKERVMEYNFADRDRFRSDPFDDSSKLTWLEGKCESPESIYNHTSTKSKKRRSNDSNHNEDDATIVDFTPPASGSSYASVSNALVVFDTPFTFILKDEVVGETFSGHISSLCDYRKVMDAVQTSSVHAWLQDVFKVAFWKCYSG